MPNWFDFKGIRSTSLGVYVTEYPPILIAQERVEYKDIPGRYGSIALTEGDCVYDDVTFSVSCFIADLTNLDAIAAWLTGYGDLVLGNRPDRRRKARVSKQIDITRILRARDAHTFDVTFRCDPFWYEADPSSHRIMASAMLENEGTVPALPEIILTGSGNITVSVGETSLQIANLSNQITIDGESKIAYNGTTSLSGIVTGDWPVLATGYNAISWTGSVSRLVITPNWRWL